ncbi:spore germination protein [Paenibacillus sp. P36]|uniref:spore germination protein n=1 Tax=Paenibacillus sp. P36 TaxID=3342538 RepID=UPI0038B281D1
MSTTAAPTLTPHLPENIVQLVETLGESSDIIIRELGIGRSGELPIAIVFTDGLADHISIHELLESLMLFTGDFRNADGSLIADIPGALERYIISLGGVRKTELMEDLYDAILSGDTAIMLDNCRLGLIVSTRGWESRGITESNVEAVVRGPRESFTETMRTNTSLIRRRIKHPSLRMENLRVGRISKTDVAFMYIKGIADDKVVDEVRNRIQRIDIDAIMDTGQIEELIQDDTFSPFPTIYNSERPDTIAAGMLEGRVAILVDGSPFVLLVPVIFTQFLQSAEDYYQRSDFGVIRMLRYVAMLISLLTPSVYIAVTTYHQEMLPTTLLLSLATQREGVPFPAFIEALLMETAFEILREAGIRMPRMVGSAISIVGALVLGEAAVQAGLVSAAMVIVVSITAIASFVMPAYSISIPLRLLRYLLMFIAASFGIYGIFLGCMCILFHLCSLRSFGVPYMSPFGPFHATDQKDAIFRLPLWAMQRRPSLIGKGTNQTRIKDSKPRKPID